MFSNKNYYEKVKRSYRCRISCVFWDQLECFIFLNVYANNDQVHVKHLILSFWSYENFKVISRKDKSYFNKLPLSHSINVRQFNSLITTYIRTFIKEYTKCYLGLQEMIATSCFNQNIELETDNLTIKISTFDSFFYIHLSKSCKALRGHSPISKGSGHWFLSHGRWFFRVTCLARCKSKISLVKRIALLSHRRQVWRFLKEQSCLEIIPMSLIVE